MQIEQLQYIVSISRYNSISESAKNLHISQSALSQSISKLEEELGLKIFYRSRLGTFQTTEGKQIITLATEVLEKIKCIIDKAEEYKNPDSHELKIGLVSGLYLPFLSTIISLLRSDFPKLTITLIEKGSIEIIDAILDEELDIGILALYENTLRKKENIHFEILYEENMYVFVNEKSPLTSFSYLTPQQLLNQSFVMFNGEYMNWFFKKFTNYYGDVEVLFTSSNSETIMDAVRKGLAITIETKMELINNPYIKSKELIPIPLREHIFEKNHLGIVTLKENSTSVERKSFIKLLKSKFKDMVKN
ncbi:LysR family transcriptional regulator [Virgibacillus necropolis]|uniref:LysR family transcriptional regulator n=1 Tax=Virgibacillus necropolis TaxID=163877 RepID=A0A221M9I8_9BACI|nr:LysR family transcriptional regulator [Virgibacillus necropolis]ASN04292.1 LysR family transcriptional regulator [Virgibacillus necropolis]